MISRARKRGSRFTKSLQSISIFSFALLLCLQWYKQWRYQSLLVPLRSERERTERKYDKKGPFTFSDYIFFRFKTTFVQPPSCIKEFAIPKIKTEENDTLRQGGKLSKCKANKVKLQNFLPRRLLGRPFKGNNSSNCWAFRPQNENFYRAKEWVMMLTQQKIINKVGPLISQQY